MLPPSFGGCLPYIHPGFDAPEGETKLLKLPERGCLRIIDKATAQWTEFELADVLVVVIENHPVRT